MYNFDILLQRKYTDCTKWDAIKRDFGKDGLMPFWVADADFPVFDEIHKALALRIGKNQTYGYTFAGDQYFTSLINWNWARHNLELCIRLWLAVMQRTVFVLESDLLLS